MLNCSLVLGKSIAVHTSAKKISTCEILPNGEYVVLALENEPNLVTLELKNSGQVVSAATASAAASESGTNRDDASAYGDDENHGKTFQL